MSDQLQLLVNGRGVLVRNKRDPLALMYWNIVFDHQQGIFLLLKEFFDAPAFALLRVFMESMFRACVVMLGPETEVEMIKQGRYKLNPDRVAKIIDDELESPEPLVQSRVRLTFKTLHGFTHSGAEQLVRQFGRGSDGMDIVSSYSDEDVCSLVNETAVPIVLLSHFMTAYLDLPEENQKVSEISNAYFDSL
jgi:hypothetical protein